MKTALPDNIFSPIKSLKSHKGVEWGDYWICYECKDIKTNQSVTEIHRIYIDLWRYFNIESNIEFPMKRLYLPNGQIKYGINGWTLKTIDTWLESGEYIQHDT